MAFGVLATVNGIGDFVSTALVGLLWSAAGTARAFGDSAALFTAGAVLVARLRTGGDAFGRLREIRLIKADPKIVISSPSQIVKE